MAKSRHLPDAGAGSTGQRISSPGKQQNLASQIRIPAFLTGFSQHFFRIRHIFFNGSVQISAD